MSSVFKFPQNWDYAVTRNFLLNAQWNGYRKCNFVSGEGNVGFGINTSRLSSIIGSYIPSGYETVAGRYSLGSQGVLNDDDFLVMGMDMYHGNPNSGEVTVVYFDGETSFSDNTKYIAMLLKLPYFKPATQGGFGNTPVSTTDRDLLTKQIYEAGMWIWRPGNLPPINIDCLINYQYDDDYCFDGFKIADVMYNQTDNSFFGANAFTGSVNSANSSTMYTVEDYTDPFSDPPWMGSFTQDGTGYIEIASTITPSSNKLTHEWIGERASDGSSDYLCDARNGNGTWLLTEYNGYDFNWSGQLQVNNGNGYGSRHWGMVTCDDAENVSRMYYGHTGSATWDGEIGTGTCSTSMPKIGADFVIGARYTYGTPWSGYWGMWRTWDNVLTATQAEICWLHERFKVYTNHATP